MTSQKFFRSTGDISIVDERLQNLGLHKAPVAFEQGGTFIMLYLL